MMSTWSWWLKTFGASCGRWGMLSSGWPSGSEAVDMAGEHRPDLILMDIKLKGPLDGIDAARMIQSRYGTPVIYLTAFSDEEHAGAARYTLPLALI